MSNEQNRPERTDTPTNESPDQIDPVIRDRLVGNRNATPADITEAAREAFEADTRSGERESDRVERSLGSGDEIDDPSHSKGSTAGRNRNTP